MYNNIKNAFFKVIDMISKFGIFIRDFRKRRGESLRAMASRMGISAAFLSSMEVGRKRIPIEYAKTIKEAYNLSEEEYALLYSAIMETNNKVEIEINNMSEPQKELSMVFARKIESADPELIEKLREVLGD